jgi:phospholipid/cholesterol/gamma-HCH transport system substrate-binding protein
MQRNVVETLVGAFVLIVALAFGWYAYSTTSMRGTRGAYELSARFDRADGLAIGTDVRVSGIKVGSVTAITLDPATFFAQVRFALRSDVKLPEDTVAEIAAEGLLGGRYLNINPGNADRDLAAGEAIKFTKSSADFMQMIGKFLFSASDDKSKAGAPQP